MRRFAGSLALAFALSAAAAAAALVAHGQHAGLLTLAIFGPLGALTVVAAHLVAARRDRVGGLRRQFAVIAIVAAAQLATAVLLYVELMFVSAEDAFFTALVAVYAAAMALWATRLLGRRALDDVDAIRTALTAVGDGRRDVRTGVGGSDELGRLAADVDAMVTRLDTEEGARRALIAAVSHDLRTPITALSLLASAIDDDIADPATRREYAARMTTHVRALSGLIDDLFELTRLESGELSLTMSRVALDDLVQETVEAMRPAAAARHVSVNAQLSPIVVAAHANPEKLQRVLFNLIQNAIRHTPADGTVTVRAQSAGAEIEVEVLDTGSGIPAEQRAHVFEPFFHGDGRRGDAGAGLGLAISRAIVEAHGGRIWLHDTAIGTSVRFRVPAGWAPVAAEGQVSAPEDGADIRLRESRGR